MMPLLDDMSIVTSAHKDASRSAFVVVMDAHAHDPNNPHGAVNELENMSLVRDLGFFPFAFAGLSYLGDELFGLGENGEVVIFHEGEVTEEQINAQRGPLRHLATIGDQLYACGADMQVFHRTAPGTWQEIGPDAAMRENFKANHLEQIDGFAPNDLYAAGRAGIVWHYNGETWTAIQTENKLNYYAVNCAADDKVYLSGQNGVLAFGRGEVFEVLKHHANLPDVWGIDLYGDIVFMAGERSMVLSNLEDFIPDDEAIERGMGTFYDLHNNGEFLFSFGAKDVMRRTMEQWQRLDGANVV